MTTIKELSNGNIRIHINCSFKNYSGRNECVSEEKSTHKNSSIIQTLARAKRWQELIDSRTFSTAAELAKELKIDPSKVIRVLKLNYLSPTIVSMLLEGKIPQKITLEKLFNIDSLLWAEQHRSLGIK